MSLELDSTFGYASELEWGYATRGEEIKRGMYQAGLITAWELQSQAATVLLLALVALTPLWAALIVMIAWALIAASVYHYARKKGLPDLLDARWSKPPSTSLSHWKRWLGDTAISAVRAWLAGIQPYLYCLAVRRLLSGSASGWHNRLARMLVLAVGLTLFGVTTVHHLLRRAGLPERMVFRYSLLAPFLDVPYRTLLSVIVLNAALGLIGASLSS
jgi:hypothetical protein